MVELVALAAALTAGAALARLRSSAAPPAPTPPGRGDPAALESAVYRELYGERRLGGFRGAPSPSRDEDYGAAAAVGSERR